MQEGPCFWWHVWKMVLVRPGGWGGGASVDGSHGGHSSTRRAFSSTPHPTPNSPTPVPALPAACLAGGPSPLNPSLSHSFLVKSKASTCDLLGTT